jgi:hypothetical protein
VARELGASDDDVKLGAAATVTSVRATPLEQYRVIEFATHGLVAGEVGGLSEPALVLCGAFGLQHGSGRQARRGRPFRSCARILLCGCTLAAGVTLAGRFPCRSQADDRGFTSQGFTLPSHRRRQQLLRLPTHPNSAGSRSGRRRTCRQRRSPEPSGCPRLSARSSNRRCCRCSDRKFARSIWSPWRASY